MARRLNLDERRAERGAAEGFIVTVEGADHELPAVLPMEVLTRLVEALDDGSGNTMRLEADDPTALIRQAPGLVDAFAAVFGEWFRRLGPDEFVAVLELYDLGGQMGEPSGS